ncbi:MAG TPA: beta-galactosidase GalA [Polyangiaceae bacterium]
MTSPRTRETFDEDWTFYRGDIAIPESVKAGRAARLTDVPAKDEPKGKHLQIAFVDKETKAEVDPETWRKLDLPHDFCIEGDFLQTDSDADKTHGYLPRGIGFYRKVFPIPQEDKGKKIVLEFDGVFRNSRVWLNGQILKDHRSGYASFEVDVTDNLRYGDEGDNCVLVRVDATDTEGWWYEGCGIYRHVWIRKTSRVHVAQWGSYITTPSVSSLSATVRAEITVHNQTSSPASVKVMNTILDALGARLSFADAQLVVSADDQGVCVQTLEIHSPRLWSPETPVLYTLSTELRCGDELVDRYETTFGVRSFEFTSEGFFLNGKHTVIKGTCNHQDFAGVGVALPDSLQQYKIRLLKQMGSNAYRCAHHPPAPELLDACDRLGMLVMDENRQLDSSEKGLADLESMIYRDRNHPCIVMWSMENEEPFQGTERGARIMETLVRRAHRLDSTRPTLSAMNHGYYSGGYLEKMDLTGINYGHKGTDIELHEKKPERLQIGTEAAACCTTRGVYYPVPEKCYLDAYGHAPALIEWLSWWTCHYEIPWQRLLRHPFLTGMFVWSGFDYRGEPSPYGWPCINSHFGILDTCGFPKDEYYYYKANWSDEPLLHVFPHWNWAGRESEIIKVWVFTNCGEVELFLNGTSLGKKRVVRESHIEWEVPYTPGELRAVGSGGLGGALEKVVRTTGAPASIRLVPDRTELKGKGDAIPVRVEILDSDDLIVPIASNLVRFFIQGPGEIAGVGNGDPSCLERDKADRRSAFNGLCLAIVKSDQSQGTVYLRAESDGLRGAELKFAINC